MGSMSQSGVGVRMMSHKCGKKRKESMRIVTLIHFVAENLAWMFDIQFHSLPYKSFACLTGTLPHDLITCILMWCQVAYQPKPYRS